MLTTSVKFCRPSFQTYDEHTEEVAIRDAASGKQISFYVLEISRGPGGLDIFISILGKKKNYVQRTSTDEN